MKGCCRIDRMELLSFILVEVIAFITIDMSRLSLFTQL
jgi:hypothetical protein